MRKLLSMLLAIIMVVSLVPGFAVTASAAGNVAKVGNTEYATIDEAVAAWTKGTTLTLLADVTLSDVITRKSTEHHILNLGTFTMTAASGKHAIEITCNNVGTAERNALTVNADATNPGGITATGKSCIYYRKSGTAADRPIIQINGGVFNGSYAVNVYSFNSGQNCPTVNIAGGIFNGWVNIGKGKLIVSGGTFNGWVNCTGDSTAYRQISGGTYKSWQFMTSGSTKFWVGTSKANYNVGCYVDDNGYLVVGGPVITAPDPAKHEAHTASYSGWSSYLQYSGAKDNGLYWTDVYTALAKNTSREVTVYVDALDMTGSSFKGTILLPETTSTLTVTYPEGTTPAWKVSTSCEGYEVICEQETLAGGTVTLRYGVRPGKTVTTTVSPAASGTVTVTSDEHFTIKPNELYAIGTSVTVTAAAKAGYKFVKWTEGGQDVSTNASYTYTVADNRALTAVFEVYQPDAPVVSGVTDTTVTLTEQVGCEYSLDGTTWQASNIFTGLTRDTAYTFYARYAATGSLPASIASAGTAAKTAKTELTALSVSIDKPVKNGTPDTTAALEANAPYTVSAVSWNCNGSFLGGTQYTATFTLTPAAGYLFADAAAITVSDAAQVTKTGDANSLTVTAVFPATDVRTIVGIDRIVTAPTKTAQTYGDAFAADGMVVSMRYDDGTTGEVSYNDNRTLFVFDNPAVVDESVGVKYRDDAQGVYTPITITVNPKAITVTAGRQDIDYGESIISAANKATAAGLVNGDSLAAITLTASTNAVTASGEIIPANAVIRNAAGADVTGRYVITYAPGQLTIGLVLDHIAVTVQPELDYAQGDTLDLSGMIVTAYYTDGSSSHLTYTDVTASLPHGTWLTLERSGEVITVSYNGMTAQTSPIRVQNWGSSINAWLVVLMNQKFAITASATDGGSISYAGTARVPRGKNITYTITPDAGYMIADVIVDGKSVGAVETYTFKRVKEKHRITAIFEKIPAPSDTAAAD